MFDDGWPHEFIDNSSELRAVLLRPLPFTGSIVNRFVTNVVGRYFYGHPVARKAEAFAKGAPPEKLAIA
jgi:aspartate beta-hydroxylase/beta-hydroxylase